MVVHACNTNTWGPRRKDQYEFEVGLFYTVSSRLTQMAGSYGVSERGVGWAEQSSGFNLWEAMLPGAQDYTFAAIGTLCHSGSHYRNKTTRLLLQGIGSCECGTGEACLNRQSSCQTSPKLETGISSGTSEQSWFCS